MAGVEITETRGLVKQSESPESEYARLFAILEAHRIAQHEAMAERESYDRLMIETKRNMQNAPGVVDKLISAAFHQVPRPDVPGELPEAKRFHELHTILAQKASRA